MRYLRRGSWPRSTSEILRSTAPSRASAVVVLIAAATVACTPSGVPESPLPDGEVLPASFLELSVDAKRVGVRGVFEEGGKRVRFFTMRGPRMPVHERLSGAQPFEMNACFVNEAGHPLVQTVGGHEVVNSECAALGGDLAPEEGSPTTYEEMLLARAAMEAIAALRFREEYRADQEVLVSWLRNEDGTIPGRLPGGSIQPPAQR